MKQSLSRRTFLGSVFAVGAATAAVEMLSRSAHAAEAVPDSTEQVPLNSGASPAVAPASYPLRTYTADIVVIGSGLAGLMAARNARVLGANVILVDKGPFGRSGASGINWGHELMSCENGEVRDLSNTISVMQMAGLADQEYYRAVVEASYEMAAIKQTVKTGTVLECTAVGEDSPHNLQYPFLVTSEPVMLRFFAQSVRNSGVQIIDRTMVLDVLADDEGAAADIVGLGLVEGWGVVVRAKAVVMCMGSSCWTGSGAKTNASPENATYDGFMPEGTRAWKMVEDFVAEQLCRSRSGGSGR